MTVAFARLECYAVAALPACALGSAAVADIIYTELNTSVYDTTTTFTMAGATVLIAAFNSNSTFIGISSQGINLLGAAVGGGAIAMAGGVSYFGYFSMAQGFAAGEEIGAGAAFGGSSSSANLAASFTYSSDQMSSASGGDWFAGYGGESRLFLGVEIANGSDVNYGWVDIGWSAANGAVIHGYAYETDVNTAIIAGATESSGPVVPGAPTAVGLMGLAAGAAGIRRKRSA